VLTEIELWEVSLTTFPANTSARTILDDEDERTLRALNDALAAKTTALAIESAFAQIRQEMMRTGR
jgi:phage head maturation protease